MELSCEKAKKHLKWKRVVKEYERINERQQERKMEWNKTKQNKK